MDSWSPQQLQLMSNGGNRRLREFFNSYSMPPNCTIQFRYYTKAAEYYRELLKSEVERRQLNIPPPTQSAALQPFAQAPVARPQVPRPVDNRMSIENPHFASNYSSNSAESSSWWGTSKSLLGGAVSKASEWASSAVETVKDNGIIGSIKSGATVVIDKSKEVGGNIAEKIRESSIGEKSLDALSTVGGYVSEGAYAAYSKVRGNGKPSLYRDIDDVPNDAGEKLFYPETNSQYGGAQRGNYVPPTGEFSWKKDEELVQPRQNQRFFDQNRMEPNRSFGYQNNGQSYNQDRNYQQEQPRGYQREEPRNYQREEQRSFQREPNYYQEQRNYYQNAPTRAQTHDTIDLLTGDKSE
eukprot:CAMPEP_0202942644 /NCGR_PEP_ID=MMETSP1395-20130829/2873_1 /ASSEMBLY_ACC=CAM_ASM_000871 /TAXON_ID=5961 /ORGANISM="Blepharisma japonicum, Strain Stock R1072" /LENGTH=352 /DNA_ID=CAMNT_0049639149 /DNA_START=171 /DNA_END=1229 /DNA_ORIENTATION=-